MPKRRIYISSGQLAMPVFEIGGDESPVLPDGIPVPEEQNVQLIDPVAAAVADLLGAPILELPESASKYVFRIPSSVVLNTAPKKVDFGPSVDVEERRTQLSKALFAFAVAVRLEGLDHALVTGADDGRIKERYSDRTPIVHANAKEKRLRMLIKARAHFKKAAGFSALIDSGLFPDEEEELEVLEIQMTSEFFHTYNRSDQQKKKPFRRSDFLKLLDGGKKDTKSKRAEAA